MGPKKRGTQKRKNEDALGDETGGGDIKDNEAEEKDDRSITERGNKKYIGAHVGIQGKAVIFLDS